jgi:formylglycine-generating enzyme required for sulfatase activity
VVPKGLRAFDAGDADFFLELVPGPRDRDGLPEGLRFWEQRVEQTDADRTFGVGLLFGPSGCGKSSLVAAGLLPRLADHVVAVAVEATAADTPARLLRGLRKRFPDLPAGADLAEALAALRRGRRQEAGRKVLLVLDQFEQFLHAWDEGDGGGLVAALRQCDGGRVQALLLVRDDFGMAAARFLRALEVRIVEGENFATVDLFDRGHARKVLALFGRAFGKLPEAPAEPGREQGRFLDEAVAGLAREGKVVPVRLALFAEMVKGRPWTPVTLREVGGASGVGVTFLEETLGDRAANPAHRLHARAARAVLAALLPEQGSDIKGHMRPADELRQRAGYAARPAAFAELLGILDGELRLVTPTDPEGVESEPGALATGPGAGAPVAHAPGSEAARYYQLTHDYLVPSVRDWLTRQRRQTRRGRAQLRLADRAALWQLKRENRHLPAWWEWLNIRLLTRKRDWTEPQRRMMRRAGRYHATRGLLLAAGLLVLLAGGREVLGRWEARTLHGRLREVPTENVPALVRQMGPYRRWLEPELRQDYASDDAGRKLHAALALAAWDREPVDYLYGRLLAGGPQEVQAVREQLAPHRGAVAGRLWEVLADRKGAPGERLRAACALAEYAPEDARWPQVSRDVAGRLVAVEVLELPQWRDLLRPVGPHLLPPLAELVASEDPGRVGRGTVARLYGDYAEGRPERFAPLEQALEGTGAPAGTPDERLAQARRRANAAATLAALGRWDRERPLLQHTPDPTLRSYLIDRLVPGGAGHRALAELVEPGPEAETSVRRAALLALGEFDPGPLPRSEQEGLFGRVAGLYRDDPDPGVHGAAGWLLGKWGRQEQVRAIDRELVDRDREVARRGSPPPGGRRWYVNGQGQTLALVDPPAGGEVEVGEGNQRARRRIPQRYALAAREVTKAEFRRLVKPGTDVQQWAPTPDCPAVGVSWYEAAEYCNRLSKEEGIPEDQWCYLPNKDGKYAQGMRVVSDCPDRRGYRLPTEGEWEYACRAGSTTAYAFGEAEDLLGRYAWYSGNSGTRSHPVGSLRPNDWGLFDLHGNAWEWCQDRWAQRAPKGIQDKTDIEGIKDQESRALRGGAFCDDAVLVRSAIRVGLGPAVRGDVDGFRPARTCR